MPKSSRKTNFDRILIVLRDMIPVWQENSHRLSGGTAKFLEDILDAIKPGAPVHDKARKSEIASSQLQFLKEFLHPSNRHGDERDRALATSRVIFEREFPGFFAKEMMKRDKIIERGKIRNDEEYYLIRDFVDELEAEPEKSELLNRLYEMVDDFRND